MNYSNEPLPRYIHYYEVDENYCALFNAITLDVIYVKSTLLKGKGRLAAINPLLLPILRRNKFLVTGQEEEEFIESSMRSIQEEIRDDQLRFLYIVPTTKCNLSCTYCHIQNAKQQHATEKMSHETLLKGLELFKQYGGFDSSKSEIMFYGGEPFICKDFIFFALDAIRQYSNTIKITIFTNGTLISSRIAHELSKYNVYVIVSLDGRKNVNDAARIQAADGSGSFDAAKKGYFALKEHSIPVGISLVAGSHNVKTLDKEVSAIADCLMPLDIGISTLHLFPDGTNPNEIPIEDLCKMLQKIQCQMREKGMYVEHIFRRMRPFVEQIKRIYDCPSCNSKVLITPWDTIGFCEAFMETEQYFYSIDCFDLAECNERLLWKYRVPLTIRECYSCPAISICGGGCPYDAYCETGDICNKDSRRCHQSTTMIDWLIYELFRLLKNDKSIIDQDFYIPSRKDREKLYGNVVIDEKIPLQNYSNSNEK